MCKRLAMAGLNRTVALVGMMGAGKSSIGRRLAARLNVPFKDADSEIELAAGCSISEIFERYGEGAFRDGERKVIARLLGEAAHVLATGGGAFADPQTRAKLKECALTVWIKAPIKLLLARVQRRDTRPLLRDGDPLLIVGFKRSMVDPNEHGLRQAPVRATVASSPPRPLLIFPIAAERRVSSGWG